MTSPLPSAAQARSTGIHPSALIVAAHPGRVTCLLGDLRAPTHLLTAGHIFPAPSRPGSPLFSGASAHDLADLIGVLVHNFLDQPPAALGFPLDAALVELTSRGAQLALLGRSSHRGSHRGVHVPTTQPSSWRTRLHHDHGRDPSAIVATATRGSGRIPGGSSRYGFYEARDVISTDHVVQAEDAGALLLEVGAELPACLGLCIGSGRTSHGERALFEPLDRLIACVNACRPRPLTLWPPVE